MVTNYFLSVPPEITLSILQRLSNRIIQLFAQTSRQIASIINVNRELLYKKRCNKFYPSIKDLEDIFELPELTLNFLSMHLNQILYSKRCSDLLEANLMLAAFISKRLEFVPQIIKVVMIKYKFDLSAYGSVCQYVSDLLAHPDTFYSPAFKPLFEKRRTEQFIRIKLYREIWFNTMLQVNRLDLFNLLCHSAPIRKAELLCWMADKYGIVPSTIIIAKMAYEGELDVFEYCAANNKLWSESIFEVCEESNLSDTIIPYAVHGNHIDLIDWLCVNYIKINGNNYIYSEIFRAFFRYNRIDWYEKLRNRFRCHITLVSLFYVSDVYFGRSTPKISLSTFEFGIKEFLWSASIPNDTRHIGVMDIEIYEKYLTNETSKTKWIIYSKSTKHNDLIALLKSRNLIQ